MVQGLNPKGWRKDATNFCGNHFRGTSPKAQSYYITARDPSTENVEIPASVHRMNWDGDILRLIPLLSNVLVMEPTPPRPSMLKILLPQAIAFIGFITLYKAFNFHGQLVVCIPTVATLNVLSPGTFWLGFGIVIGTQLIMIWSDLRRTWMHAIQYVWCRLDLWWKN